MTQRHSSSPNVRFRRVGDEKLPRFTRCLRAYKRVKISDLTLYDWNTRCSQLQQKKGAAWRSPFLLAHNSDHRLKTSPALHFGRASRAHRHRKREYSPPFSTFLTYFVLSTTWTAYRLTSLSARTPVVARCSYCSTAVVQPLYFSASSVAHAASSFSLLLFLRAVSSSSFFLCQMSLPSTSLGPALLEDTRNYLHVTSPSIVPTTVVAAAYASGPTAPFSCTVSLSSKRSSSSASSSSTRGPIELRASALARKHTYTRWSHAQRTHNDDTITSPPAAPRSRRFPAINVCLFAQSLCSCLFAAPLQLRTAGTGCGDEG